MGLTDGKMRVFLTGSSGFQAMRIRNLDEFSSTLLKDAAVCARDAHEVQLGQTND